ncbi:hypothetical protein [Legionella sp. WA2022007384]
MKKNFEKLKLKLKELMKEKEPIDLPIYNEPGREINRGDVKRDASGNALASTTKNSSANIPQDKLFVSESGYAYHIDDIIHSLGSRTEPKLFEDFLNPDNKKGVVLFSPTDIQKLLEFPSVKEAIYKFSSSKIEGKFDPEDIFTQLAETASLIKETTVQAMLNIYEAGKPIHRIIKIGNPEVYTKLMAPSMIALMEIIDKMDKREKMALKWFMDTMPYEYGKVRAVSSRDANVSLLEMDLADQMQKEKCGSGFETAMQTLSAIIHSFKQAQKAIETSQLETKEERNYSP